MSISSRAARPLLASVFISSGLDAFRHPEGKVKAAEAVTRPLTARFDALPDDTVALVRFNAGVQVAAGTLLALGKFRRLAALALIGSIIPTTYAGHRFWEEVDDEKKAQQQIHFLKNLGLLGGLILAAADTEGAPSTTWRVRHRAQGANKAGRRALHRLDDVTSKEAAKAAEVAGRLLSSGTDMTNTLLAKAEDYLPIS
jgi:putative oxidoreductase